MSIFIGIVVFGIIVILFLVLYGYNKILTREFEPDEERNGDLNSDKKALVLWVPSKHSGCKNVKNQIVSTLAEYGYFVKSNYPILSNVYNYDEFDFICYISPVYFGKVSKTLCETMVSTNYKNKKVAVVCVGKALNSKNEVDYMKSLIDRQNEFSTIKVNTEEMKIVKDFIKSSII